MFIRKKKWNELEARTQKLQQKLSKAYEVNEHLMNRIENLNQIIDYMKRRQTPEPDSSIMNEWAEQNDKLLQQMDTFYKRGEWI